MKHTIRDSCLVSLALGAIPVVAHAQEKNSG